MMEEMNSPVLIIGSCLIEWWLREWRGRGEGGKYCGCAVNEGETDAARGEVGDGSLVPGGVVTDSTDGYYASLEGKRSESKPSRGNKYSKDPSQGERDFCHPFESLLALHSSRLPSPPALVRSSRREGVGKRRLKSYCVAQSLQLEIVSLHDRHQLIARGKSASLQATELKLPIHKDLEGSCGQHAVP
jgi:hypothetical protein